MSESQVVQVLVMMGELNRILLSRINKWVGIFELLTNFFDSVDGEVV